MAPRPDAGANLVADGDFETALTGSWILTANFTQSALSTTVKHSGNSSLHVVATAAGAGSGNAIYQDLSSVVTGQSYALSFWYLQNTNGVPLTVRFSGSGFSTGSINPTPPTASGSRFTPGSSNSVSAVLPAFPPLWLNEVQAENLTGSH